MGWDTFYKWADLVRITGILGHNCGYGNLTDQNLRCTTLVYKKHIEISHYGFSLITKLQCWCFVVEIDVEFIELVNLHKLLTRRPYNTRKDQNWVVETWCYFMGLNKYIIDSPLLVDFPLEKKQQSATKQSQGNGMTKSKSTGPWAISSVRHHGLV